MTASAPNAPSLAARLSAVVPTIVAVVLLLLAAQWFGERWTAVMAAEGAVPVAWPWLLLGALCLVVHATTALVIWRQVLASVAAPVPWHTAVDVFVPALLARYVPGRIWANAARLALAKRAGVAYVKTTGALVWETLLALASAGLVATLTLYGRVDPALYYAAAALMGVPLVMWVVLSWMKRAPRGLAAPAATSLAGWLAFGAAHLAFARAVAPVTVDAYPLIGGAIALAWAIGFLAIIVPVGLGVRDGLLLVTLAPVLSPAQAMMFVALARLVQLGVDASLTGVWLLSRARRARQNLPSA